MLGFTIATFVPVLQSSLISTPYTVYSPRLKDNAHSQYTGSTLIHLAALCAVTVFALAAAGVVISCGIGPEGLAPVMWALVLAITPILLRDYARRVCFAGLRMKTALHLDSCVFFIQTAGLLALAHLKVLSAGRAFWVTGGACGIAALGWLILERRVFELKVSQIVPDLWRNWALGKWVCANSIISASGVLLYPWLVTAFHGTAATAVFSACMGVVSLTNPFINGVCNILGPKTSHAYAFGGCAAVRSVVSKAILLLAAPVALFCLAIGLFGDHSVVLMYGGKYAGHGVLVLILALSVLASTIAVPFGFGLWAMERADANFVVTLISFGAMLTLGLWLVKRFGPLGAAYGLLIGNAGASTVRYIMYAMLSKDESVRATSNG